MRKTHRGAAVLLTLAGFVLAAAPRPCHAQYTNYETGRTFNNPTSSLLDSMILHNMQRQQLMNSLALNRLSGMVLSRAAKRKAGQERIRRGQATTRFKPVAASLISVFVTREAAKTPAQKRELTRAWAARLRAFRQAAASSGVAPNDLASGFSLMFALNFEVFSGGQKASATQRASLTQDFRQSLLKDAEFQGWSEAEKQLLYEEKAINTMDAVLDYQAAFRAGDAGARAGAQAAAKTLLDAWWTEPIDSLELTPAGFGDRGKRLVKQGKTTTRFTPTEPWALSSDVRTAWRIALRERGAPENDLADAYAVCLALCYEMYSGDQVRLNERQFAWARQAMRHDTLTQPFWQGMNDRQKQKAVEDLVTQTMGAVASARQGFRIMARSQARGLLVHIFAPRPFEKYALTPDGFVLAGAAGKR